MVGSEAVVTVKLQFYAESKCRRWASIVMLPPSFKQVRISPNINSHKNLPKGIQLGWGIGKAERATLIA